MAHLSFTLTVVKSFRMSKVKASSEDGSYA